jgi:glycosyltransferase involved in cell wall biosynthesis
MKNTVLVSTVSPNDEQRGAVIRLENLIANHSNNLRLILVLSFRRKPDEVYRGIKVIHVATTLMDLPKILRLTVTAPITNAIFLRSSLKVYICPDDQVIFHLIRSFQRVAVSSITVDLCESLAENFKVRAGFYRFLSLKKWAMLFESNRLSKLENKILSDISITKILISKADNLFLDRDDIKVIPNKLEAKRSELKRIVDVTKFVFIGHVDYEPNLRCLIDCAKFLIEIDPKYILIVVGRYDKASERTLSHFKNISLLGFILDPTDIISGCFAGVAVMELATGQQNKVMDYIAYGVVPIVSRNVKLAYPGLPPFLCGDDIGQFQDAISFLKDNARREQHLSDCVDYINGIS